MFNLKDLDMSNVTSVNLTEVQSGAFYINHLNTLNAGGEGLNKVAELMQKQRNASQQLQEVKSQMSTLGIEVCEAMICAAIDEVAAADIVRVKQDWAGILRLIKDEGGWMPKMTYQEFVAMLTNNCTIPPKIMPTEPSMKVLSIGKEQYPAWRVSDYDTTAMKSLNAMAAMFITSLHNQLESQNIG